MPKIEITTRAEYDYAVSRGYEPMANRMFELDIDLRRELQREQFGGNDAEGNQKFYAYCIKHLPMVCEECGRPIRNPKAINVSHIISRGADARMAHDVRNVNILCPEHHAEWENGKRTQMRIYPKNRKTIEQLKKDYNVTSKSR